ncbi:NAD(P)-binding protein [Penicillium riverlandense]|uniref:NAD(P)-binding protein n=1 Tax=Penicillium riverlandense TaxID=1903569 RepID=UPI002547A1A9|nr:NAD(P)-binding protein [Penicillium riverlandense]KAJ5820037.1 NAD(P)-binding protein [Penicillium riverlandense]
MWFSGHLSLYRHHKFDVVGLEFCSRSVTGCSSGLGKSFAETIHAAGHRIVATARSLESLTYLPDEPNVLKIQLDVTSQQDIATAFASAAEKFGQINVVINNAGYGLMGDMEAISEEEARCQLETNFWGPVHATKEALRIFREVNPRGRGGTVVQISSMGGWIAFPGTSFYHASKFALEGFTESVAKEMDPAWNIRFLIVAPGGVRTNFIGSSKRLAPRHPAYGSSTGPFSQVLNYLAEPEAPLTWADPAICAGLLFRTVMQQHVRSLPTRLLMGAETIPLIRADIEKTLKEMDAWKEESMRCSPAGGARFMSFDG